MILQFRPGDKVRHKLHVHLAGFITEVIIRPGDVALYSVEVYDADSLRTVSFYGHELDAMADGHEMKVGFKGDRKPCPPPE